MTTLPSPFIPGEFLIVIGCTIPLDQYYNPVFDTRIVTDETLHNDHLIVCQLADDSNKRINYAKSARSLPQNANGAGTV